MDVNPYESPHERNPAPDPKLPSGRENLIYLAVAILVALVIPSLVIVFMCSAILNPHWLLSR